MPVGKAMNINNASLEELDKLWKEKSRKIFLFLEEVKVLYY